MGDKSQAFTQEAVSGQRVPVRAGRGPEGDGLIGGDPRLSPTTKAILLELVDDDEFAEYLDEFCSDGLLDPND